MSTEKNNKKIKKGLYLSRFSQLAKIGIFIFHAKDLANLWQIENPNTLYTTLKRYAREGLLIRLQKGMYSLKPASQLDPILLGLKSLHRYAYVSTETILVEAGIIQQKINRITLASSVSKNFSVAGNDFRCRKLADKFLYNETGLINIDGIKKASAERAVADLLYFNPRAHLDAQKMINWKKVKQIQKSIGYPLTEDRYKHTK